MTPASVPTTPTPSLEGSSPATPGGAVPAEPAPKKKPRVPKAEEPVTPLAKGRDMGARLLKKKSEAANLALTLQTVAYAEQLCNEMKNFAKDFEFPSCSIGLCSLSVSD